MKKGQGTFEYVLLLAGVLLIVVLAIVLLRGGIFAGGAKDVALQACKSELAKSAGCYSGSDWNSVGNTTIGSACQAFVNNYPNRVATPSACPALPTPGIDLNVIDTGVGLTLVCCGAKPE